MSTPALSVMDQIVALAKRRGFVYPASEIYGGIRGFWDYGPLGVLLKNNIRDWWWRCMVECPPIGPDGTIVDMVGLDSSIIQHPKTWKASGHVDTFCDPMVDDKETKQRFRADHLAGVFLVDPDISAGQAEIILQDRNRVADPTLIPELTVIANSGREAADILRDDKTLRKTLRLGDFELFGGPLGDEAYARTSFKGRPKIAIVRRLGYEFVKRYYEQLPSPYTGNRGTLTEPRPFNLMLDTYPGPIRDEDNKAYLRPETAQGIFLNYKNILDTTRVKVPFGVAQVGKSFRNEVTPRNFIFRSREFEQMEMEFFCPPDDALKWYEFWRHERMKWWLTLGIKPENLKFRDHEQSELSHYSKATVDIEYRYPFTAPDFGELEGIAHRGDFDLTQHQKHSNVRLDYFDQDRNQRYMPNVIEPASGLTRAVLVLLCEAFTPDETRPSKLYLKFHPKFAPIKAGIFPLVNKDGMPEIAERLYLDLRTSFMCEYDPKQAIGKRYARMDEIGTPYCITIDGQTKDDSTVTVRERDTMSQQRISLSQVRQFLTDKLSASGAI